MSFPDWYSQTGDLYTNLFNGITTTTSNYRTSHPDWKMERGGFLGPTTRRNIVQTRYRRHYGFTGSRHIVYTASPYQIRQPFPAFRSLFERHIGIGVSYFIRVLIRLTDGDVFWVQTNSYNFSDGPTTELIPLIHMALTGDSLTSGSRVVERLQIVARI